MPAQHSTLRPDHHACDEAIKNALLLYPKSQISASRQNLTPPKMFATLLYKHSPFIYPKGFR